jgi:hypothetical protein
MESKFVHADVHDKEFEGKCPADGSDLIEIKELLPLKCPRCNQNKLVTEKTKPMDCFNKNFVAVAFVDAKSGP